ncbi:MAG: hypothetical protein Tsb0013_08480 [Phycisphaerales bacterium]
MFTPARIAALSVVAVALFAYALAQPSLMPPAGPIEESGRFGTRIALNQTNTPGNASSLFIISEPGSYYLPSNADAGTRNGIRIDADNVTIDLNGFTLSGQPGHDTGGVIPPATVPFAETSRRNIIIRNGHIRGFDTGVETDVTDPVTFGFATLREVALDTLHISNTDTGIRATRTAFIADCVINAREIGIRTTTATVTGCVVTIAGGSPTSSHVGIRAINGVVKGCTVSISNASPASSIGYDLAGVVVSGCFSDGAGTGFNLQGDTIAHTCVSTNNASLASVGFGAQAIDCNF